MDIIKGTNGKIAMAAGGNERLHHENPTIQRQLDIAAGKKSKLDSLMIKKTKKE